SGCAATYAITRGVPRFVGNDGYVGSFSYEWNKWNRVQLDIANGGRESEDTFMEKTGFTQADLGGKVVLDVGCGAGRFLDVASRWGARTIGIDFSFAVEASQRNVGDRPNVDVIQADVFRLPFKDEVFDVIFSLGVLHHTRDTQEAFLSLPRHLKADGEIAVWLYYYTDKVYNAASDFWRWTFRHMPHKVTYAFCWLIVALFSDLFRMPFMQKLPWAHFRRILPVNTHDQWSWRVLDTFDWISPRYQDKDCSPERVIGWCHSADLRDVEILSFPTSIRARKDEQRKLPLVKHLPDLGAQRLVVFGASAAGKLAFEQLDKLGVRAQVVAVVDNDPAKAGTIFEGHEVCAFSTLPRDTYDRVIIASQFGLPAISQQLTEEGLVERRDFMSLAAVENMAPLMRLVAQMQA
ncbi:MAG TPA: methyltransferase domain-containing protein, partial [Vicinamibacterales bacterium]|nr:methyltransferase domain-containing protein [Vicinamibacterales bacterium]